MPRPINRKPANGTESEHHSPEKVREVLENLEREADANSGYKNRHPDSNGVSNN